MRPYNSIVDILIQRLRPIARKANNILYMRYQNYKTKTDTDFFTVAFYNVENLFDTKNDPNTLDDDFLPESEKQWSPKRYKKKLFKTGTAISNIGFAQTGKAPTIIGLAEVENLQVVQDLANSKHLINKDYGIVHFDSPDERGIDVALMYQKKYFEVTHKEAVSLYVEGYEGEVDYTRDILWVSGFLNGEKIHVLVNHWPSRRDGADLTEYKRVAAAERNREIIDKIKLEEGDEAKIIIMGDFNDDPIDNSVKKHLVQTDFYNPMEKLLTRSSGSLSYRGAWNLFDQVIFSNSFHKYEAGKHSFANAKIFDDDFLKIYRGRYKGTPFRTYVGRRYKGGYSDHFPVFIQLKLNK